jgi:hypothetical protein
MALSITGGCLREYRSKMDRAEKQGCNRRQEPGLLRLASRRQGCYFETVFTPALGDFSAAILAALCSTPERSLESVTPRAAAIFARF